MAGLAAAAALHSHFARVTIVERDKLPDQPGNRRGVPQGRHTHGLMTGGKMALDDLLPGFSAAMHAAATPLLDQPRDVAFLTGQGWLARATTGVETFFPRRPTLEHVVRSLTRGLPNVEFIRGTVTGLAGSSDNRRVVGAIVGRPDSARDRLDADLVVDATGRASRAPRWLEELGYRPPPEVAVQPYLGYASRLLRVPEDVWPDGLRGVLALPYPGANRGGAVCLQDDGYSIVTACGSGREYPPGDEEGFDAFLRSAMTPVLHEIVSRSEPLSALATTRTSTNRLRCFHQLSERPLGFVSIGDAILALNPAYGQGMTTGAMQAALLARRLGEVDIDELVRTFPSEIVALNAFAWGVATSSDMAFSHTVATGIEPPTPADIEAEEFMMRLQRAATADAWLVQQLQGAIGSLDPTALQEDRVRRRVEEWDARERPAFCTDLTRAPALQEQVAAAGTALSPA
jgi:2-polyprenyl-6-methoxyphenol hydroxylase-like FAD-dependent oxidoreductase